MKAIDRIIWAQTAKGTHIGTSRDTIGAIRTGTPRKTWMRQQAKAIGFDFVDGMHVQPVKAQVNHGRWIAMCECNGAEEVDWRDPTFYCLSCGNMDYGGLLRPVEFPENREAIEVLLLKRPMENRNWLPHEMLSDLIAENEEHGLGRGAPGKSQGSGLAPTV